MCVASGTQGGAVFFADAGVCPPGRHPVDNICLQDLDYQCMPIPAACNGTVTCDCAKALCGNTRPCLSANATEVSCILLAP